MRAFEVDATNPGAPRVTVDGVEQEGLSRVVVEVMPGQTIPQLYLEFRAGGSFAGAGDVQVGIPPAAAVRAWLDMVNPAELDQAALAIDEREGSLSRSPGVTYLAALRSLLPADPGG